MNFENVYEDTRRVESYAKLEFPGTYYLAYRDLPEIINEHAAGRNAVDFGCGSGRSTRFLQKYGFNTTGIDISEDMILKAREIDSEGDYRIIEEGGNGNLPESAFDLVLSVFTFDNIPSMEKKVAIFTALRNLLNKEGRIINLVSSPEIYVNEWASFSTKDFPENGSAVSGDKVKIIMTDVDDRRPVEDIVFSDEDYQKTYQKAGLKIVKTYRPLAVEDEPFKWINETEISPWVIYVLERTKKN